MAGIEKQTMERLVIEGFLQHYNRQTTSDYYVDTIRDMPDFILARPNGEKIGAEVTLAIFDDQEDLPARKAFQRPDTIKPLAEVAAMNHEESRKLFGIAHCSSEYISVINRRISEKIAISMEYDHTNPLILIIGIGDAIFGLQSIKDYVAPQLAIPDNTAFQEIWICVFMHCYDSERGILRIW